MTMKTIKAALTEKGWEAGEHYEKDWLKAKVPELMQAKMAEDEAVAKMVKAAAKADKAAAAAPPPPTGAAAKYPVGTVLWAKMTGFPFWPAMVYPAAKSKAHAQLAANGEVYVQFFGTNEYGYVKTVREWGDNQDKTIKETTAASKKKPKQAKDFKKAMEEAKAEIENPTELPQGEEVDEEEEEEEEEEEAAEEEDDDDDEEEEEEDGEAVVDPGNALLNPSLLPSAARKAEAKKAAKKAEKKAAKAKAKREAKAAAKAAKAANGEDSSDNDEGYEDEEESESGNDNEEGDANFGGGEEEGEEDDEMEIDGVNALLNPTKKRSSGVKRTSSGGGGGGGAPKPGSKAAKKLEREKLGEPKRPMHAFMIYRMRRGRR